MYEELPEPLKPGDLFAPLNPFKIRDEHPILPDQPHAKEQALNLKVPTGILKGSEMSEHSVYNSGRDFKKNVGFDL